VQIVRNSEEFARVRSGLEGTVALVPTMGALHAGHMALMSQAKRRADNVVASIFVNPKQFAPNEDLSRYPRQEVQDIAMLAEAGCDVVWLPSVADIYPDAFSTKVSVSGVSDRWEGEARPGHFDGVATVVAKLLLWARAHVALFGEKDFQQLAVIRRMVADLGIPVEIIGVPTVRDADGLALSSRNVYLSAAERRQATALPRMLDEARRAILAGQPATSALEETKQKLITCGFRQIDYFALVDSATLEPLNEPRDGARLIAAATIGSSRLIDNMPLVVESR
jgi:pantoate--beta-alanine ligase